VHEQPDPQIHAAIQSQSQSELISGERTNAKRVSVGSLQGAMRPRSGALSNRKEARDRRTCQGSYSRPKQPPSCSRRDLLSCDRAFLRFMLNLL
jgi:hypothetical protein